MPLALLLLRQSGCWRHAFNDQLERQRRCPPGLSTARCVTDDSTCAKAMAGMALLRCPGQRQLRNFLARPQVDSEFSSMTSGDQVAVQT